MTILTIDEAARFLRVTKRTLYRLKDIPRVRVGHSVKFVQADLEAWVLGHREGVSFETRADREEHRADPAVDEARPATYHRNPVFQLPSRRSA